MIVFVYSAGTVQIMIACATAEANLQFVLLMTLLKWGENIQTNRIRIKKDINKKCDINI